MKKSIFFAIFLLVVIGRIEQSNGQPPSYLVNEKTDSKLLERLRRSSNHSRHRYPYNYNNNYYYNNGYYGNGYYNEPCGPLRRRACYPRYRAAKIVGTAAFGGALIGAGIANRRRGK